MSDAVAHRGICACVRQHSPAALVTEFHHILPLSWGGLSRPENIIEVCAQTHYNVHFILNEFVRQNRLVPRHRPWPLYAYNLAKRAWAERVPDHPTPFWLHPFATA